MPLSACDATRPCNQSLIIAALVLAFLPIAVAGNASGAGAQFPERLVGHGGPVRSVQIAGDGRHALTASFDYSIIYWELSGEEGRVLKRLFGHEAPVNDVAFVPAPDGKPVRAVSVSDDGTFAVWDLTGGALVKRIGDTGDKVLDVAVSPDGRYAASASWDKTVHVYDLAANAELHRFEGHRGNVNSVAFSADSSLLFSASYDGDIRVWHVGETDGDRSVQHGSVVHSNGWGVNVLALLPGGGELVYGALNGAVGVVDLDDYSVEELGVYEHPVLTVAVSDEGGWFAVGSANGFIRVFENETHILAETVEAAHGPVWSLAFWPDGRQLYRAGLDDFVGRWQVEPRAIVEEIDSVYPRRFQVSEGDDPGQVEFMRKCSVCHTLTPQGGNRAGPTLHGLFGRRAGSVADYAYSPALQHSDIIWNERTVARLFDEGPDVVVPGTKMPIQRLKSVERRDALIAFLKRATAPSAGGAGKN